MTYWYYTATVQIEQDEFAVSNVIESENKFFPIANVYKIVCDDGVVPLEAVGFLIITEISKDDFNYFQSVMIPNEE